MVVHPFTAASVVLFFQKNAIRSQSSSSAQHPTERIWLFTGGFVFYYYYCAAQTMPVWNNSTITNVTQRIWHHSPSAMGRITQKVPSYWRGCFQIMPNHIHGILLLTLPDWAGASPAPTVGNIIGTYKSIVANHCLEIFKHKQPGKTMGKLWQRDYYEHIIRNEQSLLNITNYIIANPSNWDRDPFYNM